MPDLAINQALDWQERGLHYGDGLFETLLKLDGEIPLWQDHYQRLKKGCERLRIPLADEDWLLRKVSRETRDQNSTVIKIIVTRGCGGRGLRLPAQNQSSIFVLKYPYIGISDENLALDVSMCQTRLPVNRNLAGLKHLNRLDYVLATIELENQGTKDEGILCDTDGFLVEGVISNLFFYRDETMYTPTLEFAGVEGIMRERVIDYLRRHDIPVQVGRYSPELLLQAEECFMCNSVYGIRPIKAIDAQNYIAGPIGRMLVNEFSPEARSGPAAAT
jgi:4-amino-4-deoxychorismate lyase